MAIAKFPLIRYKVLDRCFRSTYKKYFIEDLIEECNKVLYEMTGTHENIKLRQIRSDIAFMISPEGWNIELAELFEGKKRIYRYEDTSFSIMNLPLNDKVVEAFRAATDVLSQFDGMPQFDWLRESLLEMNMEVEGSSTPSISFESNRFLKGIEHLSGLYQAIKNKTVLNIQYQDFNASEPYDIVLHPYYLKQYNNRWFLFGLNEKYNVENWNMAIDRIVGFEASPISYKENCSIDWEDYFDEIIGVTKPLDGKLENIVLHFYGNTGKYIVSKPLHGSQKDKWIDENTLEVRLELIPNFEFERTILSYGDNVQVIAPESIISTIKEKLQKAVSLYQ